MLGITIFEVVYCPQSSAGPKVTNSDGIYP